MWTSASTLSTATASTRDGSIVRCVREDAWMARGDRLGACLRRVGGHKRVRSWRSTRSVTASARSAGRRDGKSLCGDLVSSSVACARHARSTASSGRGDCTEQGRSHYSGGAVAVCMCAACVGACARGERVQPLDIDAATCRGASLVAGPARLAGGDTISLAGISVANIARIVTAHVAVVMNDGRACNPSDMPMPRKIAAEDSSVAMVHLDSSRPCLPHAARSCRR
ncbi:hypothetical protein XBLMG947_3414 [Xanthomonas bromi]|uniref:Uncharacterized protein n=1 Tax=Xanthomonas bromi TaxID=56449 RepID=A0A1C3NQD6_9XANT|nr:hypothetical protein XBLMG947_3414 [Xanthomonas bromi]